MAGGRRVPKIVLTGGPCGGKSSAQAMLREKLPEYGVTVLMVSEVATYLYNAGFSIGHVAQKYPDKMNDVQRLILKTQLNTEMLQEALADVLSDERVVIICDRGTMDSQAYIGREAFENLIHTMGQDIVSLRDKRYDGVVFIVTAADGAEEFYGFNNAARTESAEQARELDSRTLQAWNGHEHLKVIGNTIGGKPIDFERKKNEVLRAVCQMIGIPEPLETERKFLVPTTFVSSSIPVPTHKADILQTYLLSGEKDVTRRVRQRMDMGVRFPNEPVYTYTEKVRLSPKTCAERERLIDPEEYFDLLKQKDPDRGQIRKHRYSFIYKNQYFQLDVFLNLASPLILLEVELTDEAQELELPPFLPIVREVTGDEAYSNADIAQRVVQSV
ncbi:MAG: AAA family ATPase [bacterium]|nr:AAA family ATPase [bacterium]